VLGDTVFSDVCEYRHGVKKCSTFTLENGSIFIGSSSYLGDGLQSHTEFERRGRFVNASYKEVHNQVVIIWVMTLPNLYAVSNVSCLHIQGLK
jgi:hypothetical protein